MTDIDAVILARNLPPQFLKDWKRSAEHYPGEAAFLRAACVSEYVAFCGLSPAHETQLQETARRIRNLPWLEQVAWHCHWNVFHNRASNGAKEWPSFERELGVIADSFYLLVALSIVPLLREHHRSLGVPIEVTRATASQVACFCENHADTGTLGIYLDQLAWLRHYVRENYFRLGRMEYWLKPCRNALCAYRHKASGQIVALAKHGVVFDADGFIRTDAAQIGMVEGGWISELNEGEGFVSGHVISPFGMGLPKLVTLPLETWVPVLQQDTWVLDMHIPSGGGLTPQACLASHLQASAFFDRYFPNIRWEAMVCSSWMFNTQLEQILPDTANLVRYMQDLYLFPVPSSGQDGLWFIFRQESFNLEEAPNETSLQRAILSFLRKGHRWRGGGMFILREHVGAIGKRTYRMRWADTLAGLSLIS